MAQENKNIDIGGYGSVDPEIAKQFAVKTGTMAVANAKIQLQKLKAYAEKGEWTWKVAGLAAGLLIMFCSVFSFLADFFSLSPFNALMDVYMFVFGAIACVLEYKEELLPESYLKILKIEALFLYRPYGRAAFYVFVGLLLIAQGGMLGFLVGLFAVAVGVVVYYASRKAVDALHTLRDSLKDEKSAAAAFAQYDKDKSGYLDSKELALLCKSIGSVLTLNELESAIFVMDKNSDGRISYEEFIDWWKNKDSEGLYQ
mmetsp:Transcript_7901/g.13088  ORF Transcript_7901/g.13088 Transcript_7901/m.13088 type:complete len:257 (-) Transcript_7901:31-801(-)